MTEESIAIYEDVKRRFNVLGYGSSLLYEDYEFTDILSPDLPVKKIQLAAFYQDPPSYHNACFGVCIANGNFGSQLVSEYRSLGAPQIFEISPRGLARWKIVSDGVPRFIDLIEPQYIANLFDGHREDWAPSRIKSLRDFSHVQQLDFSDIGLLPLLDREVQVHFDRLLTRTIKQSINKYPSIKDEYPKLFRLIFRLVTAKIMADRKHKGHWLQDDPGLVVKEVEDFYFKNEIPEPVLDNIDAQNDIWEEIKKSFHFHNLSVETLAYVYEHTLMTPEFRKKTSTHGTPPVIAEYIVRHLPFQDIEENERYVFEPFSGHAIFLVAALRRLRDLLPSSIPQDKRHAYFKSMLSSLEFEDFAREVARIMLNIADYPNRNGWHLHQGDVFQSDILGRELSKSNIVLCNPPFEDFSDKEKAYYKGLTSPHKPAEILNKVLSRPPKLLGFVLPRIFISGKGYSNIRTLLSQSYSSIEILALPDNVFEFSEADTILLIASGGSKPSIHLNTGQVYEKDLEKFYSTYNLSYTSDKYIEAEPKVFSDNIWSPELTEVWDVLSGNKKLGDFAQIHRGIEYNFSLREPKEAIYRAVSEREQPNFVKGLHKVSESLEPFLISGHKYLNISPKDMRGSAYELNWTTPKVITNASRRSRGHWRITAAADYIGLYCYQTFDGIWPNDDTPLEVISAILNSPIANAYVSDFEITAKENRIETLRRIPMPFLNKTQKDRIVQLVVDYKETRKRWLEDFLNDYSFQNMCARLLKLIDAEILKAYELPLKLEKKLLGYFTNQERPVPFKFTGYYPEGLQNQVKVLQERIHTVDLSKQGSPEERARHQIEVMNSLRNARREANTVRIKED